MRLPLLKISASSGGLTSPSARLKTLKIRRVSSAPTSRRTLRHLRAILFDKRVYDDWRRSIPVVQRVVNSAYNRALGTCPMRMLFGTFITVDRGFLVPWDNDSPVYSNPSEYLQALVAA